MTDPFIDFFVALLPLVLSIAGVWALSPRHQRIWRAGLIVAGAVFSVLTFAQQARQRAQSASDTRELREQVIKEAEDGNQKVNDLKQNLNALVAESLRQKRLAAIAPAKCPSAQELADEVDKRLSARLSPNFENPAVDKPAVQTKPAPTQVPAIVAPAIPPCRADHLSECSDEQLLEWGKELVASIGEIQNRYMADIKKLDDIKGGKMDWLREFTGVGGDKDSKWSKAFELADRSATESFRNCCAERAIAYHAELLQRDHKRPDNTTLYEWVQDLRKPTNSKEYKKAREDGGKVGDVYFDLDLFQIDLNYIVSVRGIRH